MKFLKAMLPNLTIALNLALLIVIYLDLRNPTMGFLVGTPFLVLVGSAGLCSILTSILLYGSWRSGKKHRVEQEKTYKQ